MKRILILDRILVLAVAALPLALSLSVQAMNSYWNVNGSGSWGTVGNWAANADGTGVISAVPSTNDTATFNYTAFNNNVTATLAADLMLGSIVVNNTGTTAINTDNLGMRTITLSGGITINSGAGAVSFGANAANQKIYWNLSAAQSWINNGSGLMNFPSAAAGSSLNLNANQLTLGGSGNLSSGGYILGTGGVRKTGAGTLTVNAICSFSGPCTLEGGVWDANTFANVNANSSIGKGSATSQAGDLVFGGGTLRHSAANVASMDRLFTIGNANGLTATIDSSAASSANALSFTGTGALALYVTASDRTLTLTGSNTGTNTFTPVIGDGAGGGKTALIKSGAGTWTLKGANSYTGPTTVTGGTLNTTTASTGAGSYSVADAATMGVSIASPGQSLNISNLTLGACTLNITLGANNPSASALACSGALTLNGAVNLNVLGGASLSGTTIVLLSYGSGGVGTITPGTLPTVSGFSTSLTNDPAAKQLKLVFQSQGNQVSTNKISGSFMAGGGPSGAGQLVLNWTAGNWLLQVQTNGLTTNWVSLFGVTPPYTNTIDSSVNSAFYRLLQVAAPTTYTLTYNGNGSTGGAVPTDGNSPYTSGMTVTVLGNTGGLTNVGHSFSGWNTAANGAGTGYGPGSTFAIAANTMLYAQWTALGTSAPLIIYDEALTSGWSMNGWSTTVDLANTSQVHGGTKSMAFTMSAGGGYGPFKSSSFVNTALYGALSFWIHGGASGGQVLGMQFCRNGSVVQTLTLAALPANIWTNILIPLSSVGLANVADFNCFRFTSTPGATFYVDDVQLAGVPVYSVTYNGNGNTGGTAPADGSNPYPSGSTVTTMGAGSLGKTGYVFTGWNTAANGSGNSYNAGNTFSMGGNTTLYAQWSLSGASYSVTYNGNGNSGGAAPTDPNNPYTVGSTVTVLGNTGGLTNAGYTFGGWNTTTNGSGISYNPGSTFTIGASTTLYAKWDAPPFVYPYTNYNLGLLDPQLTGWPLTIAESNFVLIAESNRRPGSEVSQYRPAYWPMTPAAGNWGGTSWLDTHALLVGKVQAAPDAEILLVGDSITSQWGGGQMGTNFIPSWTNYYGVYKTVNLGIGGDKAQNVLWRLDHGGAQGIQPKACVLQIGNNNMYFTPETGINAAVQGIVYCAKNLRNKFPAAPVVLVNVFPIVAATNTTFFMDLKATHDGLNASGITNAASTNYVSNVLLLDLWPQMTNPDGTAKAALFSDGTHLTAAGYTLWATNMLPLVQQAVGH